MRRSRESNNEDAASDSNISKPKNNSCKETSPSKSVLSDTPSVFYLIRKMSLVLCDMCDGKLWDWKMEPEDIIDEFEDEPESWNKIKKMYAKVKEIKYTEVANCLKFTKMMLDDLDSYKSWIHSVENIENLSTQELHNLKNANECCVLTHQILGKVQSEAQDILDAKAFVVKFFELPMLVSKLHSASSLFLTNIKAVVEMWNMMLYDTLLFAMHRKKQLLNNDEVEFTNEVKMYGDPKMYPNDVECLVHWPSIESEGLVEGEDDMTFLRSSVESWNEQKSISRMERQYL